MNATNRGRIGVKPTTFSKIATSEHACHYQPDQPTPHLAICAHTIVKSPLVGRAWCAAQCEPSGVNSDPSTSSSLCSGRSKADMEIQWYTWRPHIWVQGVSTFSTAKQSLNAIWSWRTFAICSLCPSGIKMSLTNLGFGLGKSATAIQARFQQGCKIISSQATLRKQENWLARISSSRHRSLKPTWWHMDWCAIALRLGNHNMHNRQTRDLCFSTSSLWAAWKSDSRAWPGTSAPLP